MGWSETPKRSYEGVWHKHQHCEMCAFSPKIQLLEGEGVPTELNQLSLLKVIFVKIHEELLSFVSEYVLIVSPRIGLKFKLTP